MAYEPTVVRVEGAEGWAEVVLEGHPLYVSYGDSGQEEAYTVERLGHLLERGEEYPETEEEVRAVLTRIVS